MYNTTLCTKMRTNNNYGVVKAHNSPSLHLTNSIHRNDFTYDAPCSTLQCRQHSVWGVSCRPSCILSSWAAEKCSNILQSSYTGQWCGHRWWWHCWMGYSCSIDQSMDVLCLSRISASRKHAHPPTCHPHTPFLVPCRRASLTHWWMMHPPFPLVAPPLPCGTWVWHNLCVFTQVHT